MSRSGYSDDCDGWALIRWRGAVASAIRGARGQAFLREMRDALDAMPDKRLIESALVCKDGVCAMGAVAQARALDTSDVDPFDRDQVSDLFGVAESLVAEIAHVNDDGVAYYERETPEQRWVRMCAWVEKQIANETGAP